MTWTVRRYLILAGLAIFFAGWYSGAHLLDRGLMKYIGGIVLLAYFGVAWLNVVMAKRDLDRSKRKLQELLGEAPDPVMESARLRALVALRMAEEFVAREQKRKPRTYRFKHIGTVLMSHWPNR